jgi:hypothetical protein
VELLCLTTRHIPSLAQFEEIHSFDALIIGEGGGRVLINTVPLATTGDWIIPANTGVVIPSGTGTERRVGIQHSA